MNYDAYTLSDKAYVVGAVACAIFSAIGAYDLFERFIGHRWGDMPELAGGLFFVLTLTLGERGAFFMRNLRLIREGKPPHRIFQN